MPIARSWVEEFVAQYLTLRGYMVKTDVGIGPGIHGGRKDIDVIAVDMPSKEVLLIDVRIAWRESAEKIAQGAKETLEKAEEAMKKLVGEGYRYKKMLVVVIDRPSEDKVKEIERALTMRGADVKVVSIASLLREAIRYVDEWRQEQVRRGFVKSGTKAALPENLYMMKLLEFLKDLRLAHLDAT